MYLKKDWAILNLSMGSLYIKETCNCFKVLYFTNNLTEGITPFCIYSGNLKQCEKFLNALWAKMKQNGPSSFIEVDNLYYQNWLE